MAQFIAIIQSYKHRFNHDNIIVRVFKSADNFKKNFKSKILYVSRVHINFVVIYS